MKVYKLEQENTSDGQWRQKIEIMALHKWALPPS